MIDLNNKTSSYDNVNNYLEEAKSGIWVMNDHKWALLVWYDLLKKTEKHTLVHLDQHWDDIDDEYYNDNMNFTSRTELCKYINDNTILYDSFIAPAFRRGWFSKVYFYCTQPFEDNDPDDYWTTNINIKKYPADQLNEKHFLASDNHLVIDIDLDLFNNELEKMYISQLWSDGEINGYLSRMSQSFKQASVITIAKSPGFFGSEGDVEHLLSIVLEYIQSIRADE